MAQPSKFAVDVISGHIVLEVYPESGHDCAFYEISPEQARQLARPAGPRLVVLKGGKRAPAPA